MRRPLVSMLRSLIAVMVLATVLGAGLAGCAKRSSPTPPQGEIDTYHRPYPSE